MNGTERPEKKWRWFVLAGFVVALACNLNQQWIKHTAENTWVSFRREFNRLLPPTVDITLPKSGDNIRMDNDDDPSWTIRALGSATTPKAKVIFAAHGDQGKELIIERTIDVRGGQWNLIFFGYSEKELGPGPHEASLSIYGVREDGSIATREGTAVKDSVPFKLGY